MAAYTHKMLSHQKPLSQLLPFNEHRFDAVMAYIAQRYDRELSQFDMMKLHVMTDIFHTLETAKPVIGGSLEPWLHGPVVKKAYNRVAHWGYEFDRTGQHPELFCLVAQEGKTRRFSPSEKVDEDDFSETEKQAVDRAWEVVKDLLEDWNSAATYFHNPEVSFIGSAWDTAKQQKRDIDWNDIIDAYDKFYDTDHSHIKTLMTL